MVGVVLIPYIIAILRKYGGRARKEEVETEIYKTFCTIFQQDWYQDHVSYGIPRWKHLLAWAKEKAKEKGLIKWPKESGRGYWELTSEGYHIELGNTIKGGNL